MGLDFQNDPPPCDSDDARAIVAAIDRLSFVVESHATALSQIADLIAAGNAASAEASKAARELAAKLAAALDAAAEG